MELSTKPILPGSFVVVKENNSIYRGYKGFVQRVQKKEQLFCLKEVIGINSLLFS